MSKKYISIIDKNNQPLYIKDKEAQLEIDTIKSDLTDTMHFIGESSTEIEEDFIGKWNISNKDYSGEYLKLTRSILGYPQISYVRDKSLNEGYESLDDSARMIGLRKVQKDDQYFPNIVYTLGYNLSNLNINNIYIKDGSYDYTWHPISSLIPDVVLVTYNSPNKQNALELNIGNVASYNNKKYIWELFGWSELGSNSKGSKIIFPSMEFEPASGELVITDEDIEDNFDFDYSTGELIFNP